MPLTREALEEALDHPNVRAFLRAIRLGEGTSDEAGYRRLVEGGCFTDLRRHPNRRIWIERYKVHSTAAGAYQIIRGTWEGLVSQYGFEDFSPDHQDLAAVALIAEKRALEDVKDGRIEDAIRKCSPVWASLPFSKAGQRRESLQAVFAEFEKWGGVLGDLTGGPDVIA